jgi:uncharacterized protein with NAD-binding domain and iron-sulfur cluster
MTQPIRIAVIGGGCAAMAAVFERTRPEHRGRYQVTVYQEGWRLGGKGASGRGRSGRIEEHGLHVWMGCYDNAFKTMRDCYDELAVAGDLRYGAFQDAFSPDPNIGLFAAGERENWRRWAARFPPGPGLPGDPRDPGELLSLPYYIARTVALIRTLLLDCTSDLADPWPAAPAPTAEARDADSILGAARRLLGLSSFAGAAVMVEALGILGAALDSLPAPLDTALSRLLERVTAALRDWLEANLILGDRYQHIWEMIDLGVAYLTGIVRFGLLNDKRGLDAIDDYDYREWLRMNGASERALQAPFVWGLYDLTFSFHDGDANRPRMSAGQALRWSLRMFFTYRGAIFWRMAAGMGDIVFAPLYDALRRRGVRFEFFHRLTNVGLPDGGLIEPGMRSRVASLTFDVQAEIQGGGEYRPLVDIKGRPCWPSEPDYAQLTDGARLRNDGVEFESHWDRRRAGTKTLTVSDDFDFVLLGVSIGAIPHVCSEILTRDARWRRMTEEVKTVPTQAFQVWMTENLEQLGWQGPFIVSAFAKPFDTWCDMGHLIPEEAWREPPGTVVYFCAALPDPATPPGDGDTLYPLRRAEEVREAAADFLAGPMRHVWPRAYSQTGEFRWDLLVPAEDAPRGAPEDAPEKTSGRARFASQYWRANVNPSDRYVLHVPGSTKHRISPLDMTYDNMTIAGDWTSCGQNAGCVEAAVMSGLLAAHALCGTPALGDIVGYDHP